MSNYIKSVDFAAKDDLVSGDPGKIIKGTEINTEYNNIATAVTTKAENNSPAFTGNPTATTQTTGNNTTRLATTAFVQASIGTIASQDSDAVAITGGTITGITDLTVADGGTGASTHTANSVLVGEGTSAISSIAPSTSGNLLTSDGTNWASSTPVVVPSVGVGQTWQLVTRSLSTTYTNSTGGPIEVSVRLVTSTAQSNSTLIVDGLTIALAQNQFGDRVLYSTFSAVIPNGSTYSATTSGSVQAWHELR
tara:strand:+ start:390 stop:1142 length:753 start_codon:yes stop_codon:yes gene_type:complete